MPNRLLREPLSAIEWRSIRPEMRESLLEQVQEQFIPTGDAVNIAMAVQNAMFESLRTRNPAQRAERARLNALLALNGPEAEARALPYESPVAGGMLMAQTGMGKSTILKAALNAVAPVRVISHGRSEAYDWARLDQVAYLFVDFPANGSPWALCFSLAGALDSLLGTNYAKEVSKSRNTDVAMFKVSKFILMHRVGCVVIDEVQRGSFDESRGSGDTFIRYFKRLLNFGVPVILCGHPDAFTELRPSAQLSRRFSGIGCFELTRARDRTVAWWDKAFTTGVMRFCLVDSIGDPQEVRAALSARSAGVPAFFCVLWKEAQRIALRRGTDSADLAVHDVEAAARSPSFRMLSEIATWLDSEDPAPGRFLDLQATFSVAEGSTGRAPIPLGAAPPKVPDALVRLTSQENRRDQAKAARVDAISRAKCLAKGDLRKLAGSTYGMEESSGLVQGSIELSPRATED
jgi:hypothetical protein